MLRKTQSEKIGKKGRKEGQLRATGWMEKKNQIKQNRIKPSYRKIRIELKGHLLIFPTRKLSGTA